MLTASFLRAFALPFVVGLLLVACAAPSGAPAEEAPPPMTTLPGPSADSGAVSPICPPVDLVLMGSTRANYSLGYENFRNLDYCGALLYLRWIRENDPLFTGTDTPDDRNYRRLATTYEELAAMVDSTHQALRRSYLDSALAVRAEAGDAMRAAGLPYDEAQAKVATARFYQIYAADYPEAQDQILELYIEGFRENPDAFVDYDLNRIGQLVLETGDREAAVEILPELIAAADDATYLEQVYASASAPAFTSPEERLAFLVEEFRGGNREPDVIREAIARAYRLERDDLLDELLPAYADQNPTPELLAALASRAARRGDMAEGRELLDRAVAMAESNTQRRDFYYRMAAGAFRGGQRGEAYRLAGQALQYDGGHGPSLYLQASVVAGTVSRSGQARAGYWCVADLFSRAAATGDPSIAASARRAAARYSASGPSREQYIFWGWSPGMRVSTSTGYGGCTTTVR